MPLFARVRITMLAGTLLIPGVSEVIGFIKRMSVIHVARTYGERHRNFARQHFWARGYFMSTVGRVEARVRNYIRSHDADDRRVDQLRFE